MCVIKNHEFILELGALFTFTDAFLYLVLVN